MPDDRRDERKTKTPPAGVQAQLAPEYIPEEVTGNYSGEELAQQRAKRPTPDRLAHLEKKHDGLDAKVDGIAVSVANIEGQMTVLPQLITTLTDELKSRREDEHLVLKQTLEVSGHEAKSRVDTAAFAAKTKWKVVLKLAGAFTSAAAVGAIASLAAQHC